MSPVTPAADKREQILLRRIPLFTWLFIVGLVFSGATAIPLPAEIDWLVNATGAQRFAQTPASTNAPAWATWLLRIQSDLHDITMSHPVLF